MCKYKTLVEFIVPRPKDYGKIGKENHYLSLGDSSVRKDKENHDDNIILDEIQIDDFNNNNIHRYTI